MTAIGSTGSLPRRSLAGAMRFFFHCLLLSTLSVLALPLHADEASEAQIAKLNEEKQELSKELAELRGKPAGLQQARDDIAQSYRDMVRLETRMRGFQAWNALVAAISVFNDSIVKVSPGGSTIHAIMNFTANFGVDRAVDASKKYDSARPGGGHLPAKVKKLADSVVGISPALRQLDHAMRMTEQQVADEMVYRGMVENTWLQRWQKTPEAVAKSNSVVTGKITFIQERIGPAKSALIEARKDIDQIIPAVNSEIQSLQRRIQEIEQTIARIQRNQSFAESLEAARNVEAPPPTEDIQVYPGEAKSYSAAAGAYQQAWADLKAGTINGNTYRLLGRKSSYDASAYMGQMLRPHADAWRAASDYYWKELPVRLRGVSDSETRSRMWRAASDRLRAASDRYRAASERESNAYRSEYLIQVQRLQEEERNEISRREAFFRRIKQIEELPTNHHSVDIWNRKINTHPGRIGSYGTSGYSLAATAWSPIYSLTYLYPVTAPIGRLEGSAERYRQWQENAGKTYDFAREIHDTASSKSSELVGLASQLDSMASELKPNIALWDGIHWSWWSNSALDAYARMNDSSKLFNQYASMRNEEAKRIIELHRDNWQKSQRGEAVMRRAEQILPKARELLEIKAALSKTYHYGGISSFAAVGRHYLQWNHVTQEEIDRVKTLTQSLNNEETIEQHVFKQMTSHYYWQQDDSFPRHTRESLNNIRKQYAQRNGLAGRTFNDYQSQWQRFDRAERDMNQQIAAITRELNDIAPGQSVYLLEDELYFQIRNNATWWQDHGNWYWSPPNPQDLPAGWPTADSLFAQMDAALVAYEAKLAVVKREIAAGFPKRAAQIDALAARARSYARAQQVGSGWSDLQRLNQSANDIYRPIAETGLLKPEMRIQTAMRNFRSASYEGSSRLSYLQNRDTAINQFQSFLNDIDALLRQPISPQNRARAEEWRQSLDRSLQPNSWITYYASRQEGAAVAAIQRGRNSQQRLIAYLASFTISNSQIHELYQSFISAYGRGDIRALLGLLSEDWQGGGGADRRDVEDTLINAFKVFDRIQYRISNFNVQPIGNDIVRVSYSVMIIGENNRQRLRHEESSQVVEEVGLVDGKPRILRTLSGNQWLR